MEHSPWEAVVYVRRSRGRAASEVGSGGKLDIDIADGMGRVCVRLRGFSVREFKEERDEKTSAPGAAETLLLGRKWEARAAAVGVSTAESEVERWVVLDSLYKERLAELAAAQPLTQWRVLAGAGLETDGAQVFACIQSILRGKPKRAVWLQVVCGEPNQEPGAMTVALSGLLKSASQENPKFKGQLIRVASEASAQQIAQAVQENGADAAGEIRYVNGVRAVACFRELSEVAPAMPWRRGGVYLITGSAGGLGLIVAREMVGKAEGSKIILTGRSRLSEHQQAQVQALQDQGGSCVEYRELDVTDASAVQGCIRDICARHGGLHGIVHSAGVVEDNFILKKTVAEWCRVLAPKVRGTVNLDGASQACELD